MESIENIKNYNSKINLNNIYTNKEIEDIKKIIPKLKPLISNVSSINTINRHLNQNSLPKEIFQLKALNHYIDKQKFIELILEKVKNIFKEENNIILTKSISFILEEIQKLIDNPKKKKIIEYKKLTKNSLSINFDENSIKKLKNPNFYKKNIEKNAFYIKLNSAKNRLSSHSNEKSKTNEFIPYSPNNKRYINNINQTIKNEKYRDYRYKNGLSINNIKGNSIINNFITVSNSNPNLDHSSYINLNNNTNNTNTTGIDINTINDQILLNKNKIYYFKNISNNNKSLNISNKNNNNDRKPLLSPKFKKIELKNNYMISHLSPSNLNSKYLKNDKYLKYIKNKLTDYDLSYNSSTNNSNYFANYIKKIEKFNTNNFINTINNIKNTKSYKKVNQPYQSNTNQSLFNNEKKEINKKEITNINYIFYSKIEKKDFDILDFDSKVGKDNTLLLIGNYIYKKFSFSSIIKLDKFNNWCRKLAAGYYRKNPYHNDLHASDVAQTAFIYLLYGKIINKIKINKISICSIILSCLCHDFKHPGVNNNFLKESKNELSFTYNDCSILENMHIAETFKLINKNPDCNIFSGIEENIYKEIRKEMISCVLSTDMANHSKHIEFMKNILEKKKNNKNKKNINNDNIKYLELIVHSADISNPTKPFNIYFKWAKLVVEEFSQQGDKEKALGLTCTFDRKKIKLNISQISFIDYVVESFVSLYVTIFPDLKFLHNNIINNREKLINYDEDSKQPENVFNRNNNNLKANKKINYSNNN